MASISEVTHDLLSYEGTGTFGKFDHCFGRACQYLDVKFDENSRRKYRTYLFHFLRVTGYLDSSSSGSSVRWSVAPEAIVQRGTDSFALLGNSETTRRLSKLLDKSNLHITDSQYNTPDLRGGVSLLSNPIWFKLSDIEASQLARRLNIVFAASYQERLFSSFPNLSFVLQSALSRVTTGALFEPNTAELYDFGRNRWSSYSDTRPSEPGLYRRAFDFRAPDYFVASRKRGQGIEVDQVRDREWALVCAAGRLGHSFRIRYSRKTKELSVSLALKDLPVPTLLERCFRSGTLEIPKFSSSWATYAQIPYQHIWKLIAKLPIFEVEST